MSKRLNAVLACSLAVILVATACSDAGQPFATAPIRPSTDAPKSLLGGLVGGLVEVVNDLLVPPVHRTTPLPEDVTWTFTAGPGGAVSSNSAVGLKIVIPSGALSTTQTITVTALAGSPVAYGFEPHLVFSRKVKLTQNLDGTDAGLLSALSGAHFETDRLELNEDGLASVTEIVPALTSLLTRKATFEVTHFSGWILAGRSDE